MLVCDAGSVGCQLHYREHLLAKIGASEHRHVPSSVKALLLHSGSRGASHLPQLTVFLCIKINYSPAEFYFHCVRFVGMHFSHERDDNCAVSLNDWQMGK